MKVRDSTKVLLGRIVAAAAIFAIGVAGLWVLRIGPSRQLGRAIAETTQVHEALRRYYEDYGELPEDGLQAIGAALLGDNLEGLDYLPKFPEAQKRPGPGEILDAYGHPYRFLIAPGNVPMVHSAGPNGEYGDEDDLDELSYAREVGALPR